MAAALVVVAYFVGSFPTGFVMARARGVDIRAVGSGNIGATNVARSLGKKLGVVVLFLDAFKGALPVVVALVLDFDERVDPFVVTAAGVAAMSGHCFSPWLGFHGGKGVATSWGVFLAVDPLMGGVAAVIFALVYAAFRVASLGSLAAATSLPAIMWLFGRSDAVVTLAIACAVIIAFKHRGNVRRLVRGEEHKV